MEKKRVLISGGTGLVGTRLKEILKENGYEVLILTRGETQPARGMYHWDPEKGELDPEALRDIHGVVNLAGASIADGRWSKKRKDIIQHSRVRPITFLSEQWKESEKKPGFFLSASATGYYGDRGEEFLTEESRSGSGFLADTVLKWEAALHTVRDLGIRTIWVRIGIVLSAKGGALPRMALPVKLYLGSSLGPGHQYMSWIHIDDLCGIFLKAMVDTRIRGAINGVAPAPVTNRGMMYTLGRVLHKPLLFPPVPSFVLKLAMGEMSHLVLDSARVSSQKIQEHGYVFLYPGLQEALEDLFEP